MDIFFQIGQLIWFLLGLVLVGGLIFGQIQSLLYGDNRGDRKASILGFVIFSLLVFLVPLVFILNNYLGTQWIEGEVVMVHKGGNVEVSAEFSETPRVQYREETKLIDAFEVAVLLSSTREMVILSNSNNLFRWKFNKKAIQVYLESGKKYRFLVCRIIGNKNILEAIEIR